MTYIFYAVICLLLLTFLKQAFEKLHPIVSIIVVFIIFQFIIMDQIIPLFRRLHFLFGQVPFANLLLASVVIIIVSEFVEHLLEEHDYETIAHLVKLSANVLLVSFWLKEAMPFVSKLQNLMEAFEMLR